MALFRGYITYFTRSGNKFLVNPFRTSTFVESISVNHPVDMAKAVKLRDPRGDKHKLEDWDAEYQDEDGTGDFRVEIEESDAAENEGLSCDERRIDQTAGNFEEQWVKRMLVYQQLFASVCLHPYTPIPEAFTAEFKSEDVANTVPSLPAQTLQRRLRAFAARVSFADLRNIERGCSEGDGVWWRAAADDAGHSVLQIQGQCSPRHGVTMEQQIAAFRGCQTVTDNSRGRHLRLSVTGPKRSDLARDGGSSLSKWMAFLRFLRCLAAPPADNPGNCSDEMLPLHSDDDEYQAPLCMNRAGWGQRPSVFLSYFLTKHLRYSGNSPLFSFESLKEWCKARGSDQEEGAASEKGRSEHADSSDPTRESCNVGDHPLCGLLSSSAYRLAAASPTEPNVSWQPPCMFHTLSEACNLRAEMIRADESAKQLQPLLTFHTTWSSAKIRKRIEHCKPVAATAEGAPPRGRSPASPQRSAGTAEGTVRRLRVQSVVKEGGLNQRDPGALETLFGIPRTCTVSAIVDDKVLKLNGLKPSFIARVEAAQSNIQKRREVGFAETNGTAWEKSPPTAQEKENVSAALPLTYQDSLFDSFEYLEPASVTDDETSSGDSSSNESEGYETEERTGGADDKNGANDDDDEGDYSETEPQEEEVLVNATLPFLPCDKSLGCLTHC